MVISASTIRRHIGSPLWLQFGLMRWPQVLIALHRISFVYGFVVCSIAISTNTHRNKTIHLEIEMYAN